MLDLIEKLLPKNARIVLLLVLLTFGGGWVAVKGKDQITAWAQEAATTQVKVIVNDEVREAAKEAATDAAVKAARAAAKEVTLDKAALEQRIAEQNARIEKLEAKVK
jgi:hypothetical protein